MPIYRAVIDVPESPKKAERLVAAKNMAAAFRHVAHNIIAVEVAKPSDLVALTKRGIEVEQAGGGE